MTIDITSRARSFRRFLVAVTWQPEFNVAVFAVLLNYPWEFLQVPLFDGLADAGHWDAIKGCTVAALGDAVITLVAYGFVAALAGSRRWILAPSGSQLALFVVTGLSITTVIEWLALRGLWVESWSYSPLMPIVPGIGIGLAQLLQWTVLPLLVVWFVRRQLAAAPGPSA
jgi:hypothetical protein